jgi:hypothetical protein
MVISRLDDMQPQIEGEQYEFKVRMSPDWNEFVFLVRVFFGF